MNLSIEDAVRYMGAGKGNPETRRMAEETAAELEKRIAPKYTWRACRIERAGDEMFLPDAGIAVPGKLAAGMLRNAVQ